MEKLDEYKQRQREWRDISVTQLSAVNYVLLTLSTGLLVFGFSEWEEGYWTFPISSILLCISIVYGFAVMFTRLYDFRISRHLALCRQRYYEKKLPNDGLGKFNFCNRLCTLYQVLFLKIEFIDKGEIKDLNPKELKNKFNELRKKSKILGESSWIWTKYQTLYFLLGGITFLLFQFIKN